MPGAAMKFLILLGTLAPAVAGLVVKASSSIHVGGRSIGAQFPTIPQLCSIGEVSLYGSSEGKRFMFFGDDRNAVQTEIKCLKDLPCSTNTTTCNCPCEYDEKRALPFGYEALFDSNIQGVCNSTASSNLLMIGLGGGDFTQHLLYQCPNLHVTAVEVDSSVVLVAMNGLGVRQTLERFPTRLDVIVSGGYAAATAQRSESYDAVLVDCMGQHGVIPPSCQSNEFVEEIRRVLKPGGIFLQSMWSKSYGTPAAQVSADYQDALRRYGEIFKGQLAVLNVYGGLTKVLKMNK